MQGLQTKITETATACTVGREDSMKINIGELVLTTFLQGSERYITGHELKARAKKQDCLTGGREVAEEVKKQLNASKNSGLSAEARKAAAYICIPAKARVWYLGWDNDDREWYLGELSLDGGFGDSDRLLRPRG